MHHLPNIYIHSREYRVNIARVLRKGYRGEYTIYLTYIHSRGYRVNITRVLRSGYRGEYIMHYLLYIYTQQRIQSQYNQSAKEGVQSVNIPYIIYLTYIHSREYRVNITRVLERGYRGKYIPCTIYLTYIHSGEYRVIIARVLRRGYRGEYTMHHLPNIYTQQGIQSQYNQSARERVQG